MRRSARHTITAGGSPWVPTCLVAHGAPAVVGRRPIVACTMLDHDGLRAAAVHFGSSEPYDGEGVLESFVQIRFAILCCWRGRWNRGVQGSAYLALDLPATNWFFLKNAGFVPESLLGRNPEAAKNKGRRRRGLGDDMTAQDTASASTSHRSVAPVQPEETPLPLD